MVIWAAEQRSCLHLALCLLCLLDQRVALMLTTAVKTTA